MWPETTSKMIEYWVSVDTTVLQNSNGPFDKSTIPGTERDPKSRSCTKSFFLRELQNGETVKRTWLCYSVSKGKVYCLVCKLFGGQGNLSRGGFNDWKHSKRAFEEHECSVNHCSNILTYARRSNILARLDERNIAEINERKNYWREVIKRCISVICFLAERGLALRGDDELIGSKHNGNYLGIIELLSEYDAFLAEHIQKHANKGRGHTNYLSSTICDEIISFIGQKVLDEIVNRIKDARYYTVSVDSTPDISHSDQLSVTIRYVEDGKPVERFLTFLPNTGHSGRQQADALLEFLDSVGLDPDNIRGQSYDNAANMSGRYNGMQAILIERNQVAYYVPCFAHSLNLVGQASVGSCAFVVAFFDFVQELYVFFTASTARFQKLNSALKDAKDKEGKQLSVPKSLSDTRWSAHNAATQALLKGYNIFMNVLDDIASDDLEKAETRHKANSLYNRMTKLETGFYSVLWGEVLERFDKTSKSLQSETMDLNTAVLLLGSLCGFVESLRDEFEKFVQEGKTLSGAEMFSKEKMRNRKRNVRLQPLDYAKGEEAQLTVADEFRVNGFIAVIDTLQIELRKRSAAYEKLSKLFGFLRNITRMSCEDIESSCRLVIATYTNDLSEALCSEMLHFSEFLKRSSCEIKNEMEMYEALHKSHVKDTFPNVEVLLRIFLSLMVTNCCGERSFSKLKLVKNSLRSVMSQERLNDLVVLATESDIRNDIDINSIIEVFAKNKCRKKLL